MKEMEDRIIYKMNENIINPDCVGLITILMDDNIIFEYFKCSQKR